MKYLDVLLLPVKMGLGGSTKKGILKGTGVGKI